MIKISIIIPAYNAEQYLVRCVESIISQNFEDLEILCVNDGSTDGTALLMESLAQKYPCFRPHAMLRNCGPAAARNRGLVEACGSFVLFVDVDDCIEPGSLHALYQTAVQDKVQAVGGGVRIIKNGLNLGYVKVDKEYHNVVPADHPQIYYCALAFHVSILFSRDILIKNNIRYKEGTTTSEDGFFLFTVFFKIHSMSFLPRIIYARFLNPDTNTTKKRCVGWYIDDWSAYACLYQNASSCGKIQVADVRFWYRLRDFFSQDLAEMLSWRDHKDLYKVYDALGTILGKYDVCSRIFQYGNFSPLPELSVRFKFLLIALEKRDFQKSAQLSAEFIGLLRSGGRLLASGEPCLNKQQVNCHRLSLAVPARGEGGGEGPVSHIELKEILEKALSTRLSVTNSRLSRFSVAALSLPDRIVAAKWLLLCGNDQAAFDLLAAVEPVLLDEHSRLMLDTLRLRLALKKGDPLPPSIQGDSSLPKWAILLRKGGEELVYPFNLIALSQDRAGLAKPILLLTFRCSACHRNIEVTERCDLVPLKKEKDTWLCPHCLATLEWNARKARDKAFAIYKNWIGALPKDEQGYLSEDDALKAAAWAQILRPLGLIRFLHLFSSPIGNFAGSMALYIREKLAGKYLNTLDFVGCEAFRPLCNSFLLEMFSRFVPITPLATQMALVFPHVKTHNSFIPKTPHNGSLIKTYDNSDLTVKYPFSLYFTDGEQRQALEQLEKMGIPPGSKIACLQVRDGAYYQGTDWQDTHRNFDIDLFRDAAEYLVSQGYYVVRTGVVVEKKLVWASDHIIDYAVSHRSEFMDVWLFSYCDLVISTGTGPDFLAAVQGKHVLYSCYVVPRFALTFHPNISTLFANLYRDGKLMSIADMLTLFKETDYDEVLRLGVVCQPNSSEEILDAVREKLELMSDVPQSREDDILQLKYKQLYAHYAADMWQHTNLYQDFPQLLHGPIRGRASRIFLRQHRDELLAFKS